jgi:release factor glutamine methyltransferase
MFLNSFYQNITSLFSLLPFIDNPKLEARILICHFANMSREDFFLNLNIYNINDSLEKKICEAAERRISGKSISSIIGYKDFYDCTFFVDDNVLIPRSDTELIVERAIEIIKKNNLINIIDIGTGPGTILITLIKHCEKIKADAVEISEKALELCYKNIIHNIKNDDRINLINEDFFSFKTDKKYDLIISNPPYIPKKTAENIRLEHTADDPLISLAGGETGMDFYHAIKDFAVTNLNNSGYIILEHGYDQRESVKKNIF